MISLIFKSAAKMDFCISTGMKSKEESESQQFRWQAARGTDYTMLVFHR